MASEDNLDFLDKSDTEDTADLNITENVENDEKADDNVLHVDSDALLASVLEQA